MSQPAEPEAPHYPQRLAVSEAGMVVTAHDLATRAGAEMLAEGGNAIDAAVAAAFALGVCEPAGSGLGGQSMALVHLVATGETHAVDGSSRAPARSDGSYRPPPNWTGYRSTTVPSTPAMLDFLRQRWGRLPLARLLEPAIRLATEGYRISALQHRLIAREREVLAAGAARAIFLTAEGQALPAGAVLRQPALGRTLLHLAEAGVQDFYTGEIARAIDTDFRRHDGWLQADDLAQVPWPSLRPVVWGRWQGRHVASFPPPGSGMLLRANLKTLATIPPEELDFDTTEGMICFLRVLHRNYQQRADRGRPPRAYDEHLSEVSHEHPNNAVEELAPKETSQVPPPEQQGETTHLSTVDRWGNAVALTQSIERVFGAAVVTEELGFLYNNYMISFDRSRPHSPYYLRPHAVPRSNVAPTLIFEGGQLAMALGSPGSHRIVPTLLQILLRRQRQSLMESVSAPRAYCSPGRTVSLEAARFRSDLPAALTAAGFAVRVREPFSFYLGCVGAIERQGSLWWGVADLRRDGSAAGPEAVA